MTNNEMLLNAIINGDSVEDFVPQSRNESMLKKCAEGCECEEAPQSRVEYLLKQVAHKIVTSAGLIEVATAAEMNEKLIADNVGKAFKFTGTTDANYTSGDIYIVEVS